MGRFSSGRIQINRDWLRHRPGYYASKRVFDFVASFIGLIVLSPLFLVLAVLIKVEDGGPVFYKQTRLGIRRRKFEIYKFRSMCVDADQKKKELLDQNEVDGAMFKMKDDPRVTKVGKFIRKYSLDELPQLLNVLFGQMSLVGPRPPLPEEVREYTRYDMQRLLVTPGCTGLWQVTGRNDVGFDDMVQLDLEYIMRSSFMFDLYIIFKTVGVMINPNSAY